MRIVRCETMNGFAVENNSRICAERRMLELMQHRASVAGVSAHKTNMWIVKRIGVLHVERRTADGSFAISLPCKLCRIALDSIGVKWFAHLKDGSIVSSQNAPPSEFTSRQKYEFKQTF